MAELNFIYNRGFTHQIMGSYTYIAASETADTIGDFRLSYATNIYNLEKCTVANASKGGGTWVSIQYIASNGDIRFGSTTNHALFEADGTLKLVGTATGWEDDNLDPTTLTGTGNLPTLITFASTTTNIAAFSGTQTDQVEGCREIPHRAKLNIGAGTDVVMSFHAHTYATTATVGNVRLGLEYFFTTEGVAVTTSTTIYKTYTTNGIAWAKQSVAFDDIIVPNQIGSQFHFRFFRLGGDALDTYNSQVAISTIGYHYEIDTPAGSRETLVK